MTRHWVAIFLGPELEGQRFEVDLHVVRRLFIVASGILNYSSLCFEAALETSSSWKVIM